MRQTEACKQVNDAIRGEDRKRLAEAIKFVNRGNLVKIIAEHGIDAATITPSGMRTAVMIQMSLRWDARSARAPKRAKGGG